MTSRIIALLALLAVMAAAAAATRGLWGAAPPPVERGRLLLGNQLLEPPYRIEFTDTLLQVNGHEIARVTLAPEDDPADLSTDTVHGLVRHAFSSHDSIAVVAGKVEAMKATLSLLRSSPLVDSATELDPDTIEVRYTGDPYPELLMFGQGDTPDWSAKAQENFLRERQKTIAMFLAEDRLVILHDGVLVATEPGTASATAKALEAAEAAPLTAQARRTAIARVIPDTQVAHSIADAMTAKQESSP